MFKGGTSLSKVFGVIDRFSGDIDLCLVPEFVGADAAGFDALTSRVKRDAAVLEMQRLCADKVKQVLLPLLEGAIINVLGTAPAGKWLHYELDVDAKSPILYFRYPTSQGHGIDYMRREVKLELGTLTDQQPTGRYPIAPMVASVFVPLFSDWQCEVVALELQRTFWEKATILHAEYHRPHDSPTDFHAIAVLNYFHHLSRSTALELGHHLDTLAQRNTIFSCRTNLAVHKGNQHASYRLPSNSQGRRCKRPDFTRQAICGSSGSCRGTGNGCLADSHGNRHSR